MTREECCDLAPDVDLVFVDDLDAGILGVAERAGGQFVLYSVKRIVAALVAGGMSERQAREWFDFNIVRGSGDDGPGFLLDLDL